MRQTMKQGILVLTLLGSSGLISAGCGPSDEQIAAEHRVSELEGQLRDAQHQRETVDAQLNQITAQNRAMVARLQALGENVSALQTERGNLQDSLDETTRALEELRARERQAQARLETFRGMLERFRAMIASGRLRVRIARNRMVVELQENILFDSGEATLKAEGETALSEIAQVLATIPGREFQIAGHTDNVPIHSRRFPSNWELSTTRAVNVTRFLVEHGIDSTRVSAAGHAESAPVASNDTPEGRAQNRRIEIVLMRNLDELPDLSSLETSTNTPAAPPAQAPAPTPAPTPAQAPASAH